MSIRYTYSTYKYQPLNVDIDFYNYLVNNNKNIILSDLKTEKEKMISNFKNDHKISFIMYRTGLVSLLLFCILLYFYFYPEYKIINTFLNSNWGNVICLILFIVAFTCASGSLGDRRSLHEYKKVIKTRNAKIIEAHLEATKTIDYNDFIQKFGNTI